MRIAKLSLKTGYPTPGTDEWLTLRTRALESLAHDAELRVWARDLGATVKPSAVDTAVKETLAGAFPGKTAGTIDQVKVDTEFKTTGMTRALLRERIETKLLAQAAAEKIRGSPKVTDAQVEAQYEKDKATLYAQPERRKVRHILVKTKALADEIYADLESSDANFAALAKQLLDRQHEGERRRPRRRRPQRPREAVRRRRVHDRAGRRLGAGQDPVRLARDPGAGAGPRRRARARSTTR